MPASPDDYVWVYMDAPYLREQAERLLRIARDCPHQPTAYELEVIGIEFKEKAEQLDQLQMKI